MPAQPSSSSSSSSMEPRATRVLVLILSALGIFSCFLAWGYFQEKLTTTDYGSSTPSSPARFNFFVVTNLTQSLIACCCAALYASVRRIDLSPAHTSWDLRRLYLLLGFISCVASPIGYSSLKYINFPTMTLSKSCKLVPVMAVQVLVYRKRYPLYKYLSVALITVGVSGFFFFTDKAPGKETANSLWGIFLVSLNLLLDGFTNSTEDVLFKNHRVNSTQLMFFLNLAQAFLMTLWLLNPWNPELSDTFTFFANYPHSLYDLLCFCLAGALGQTLIFFVLERFGSLTLVTITVTRKLFSIVVSVIAFGHSISLVQWVCVFTVFFGIGLEAFMKEKTHHVHSHGGHHGNGVDKKKPQKPSTPLTAPATPLTVPTTPKKDA